MKYEFANDDELKAFIAENVITTMEAAEILNCSRQNIDRLVTVSKKLTPIKKLLKDKLFLKSEVEAKKN